MHLHREAFQRVGEIVRRNGQLPESYFWEYFRDVYATTQAIAVRRQAENDPRVLSLGRLLFEISEDPSRVTRAFFVGMFQPETKRLGERGFDKSYAGSVGTHLDPAIPRGDLKALTSTAAAIKTYVDEHLAHADAKPRRSLPTFKEIDKAVDQIGDLFTKYANLLTAVSYIKLVPEIQHDWLAIFRQPWIRA